MKILKSIEKIELKEKIKHGDSNDPMFKILLELDFIGILKENIVNIIIEYVNNKIIELNNGNNFIEDKDIKHLLAFISFLKKNGQQEVVKKIGKIIQEKGNPLYNSGFIMESEFNRNLREEYRYYSGAYFVEGDNFIWLDDNGNFIKIPRTFLGKLKGKYTNNLGGFSSFEYFSNLNYWINYDKYLKYYDKIYEDNIEMYERYPNIYKAIKKYKNEFKKINFNQLNDDEKNIYNYYKKIFN